MVVTLGSLDLSATLVMMVTGATRLAMPVLPVSTVPVTRQLEGVNVMLGGKEVSALTVLLGTMAPTVRSLLL